MNDLFIQSISIDWDEISEDSYLRRIEVLKNMQSLQLCKPITIFTGESGSGTFTSETADSFAGDIRVCQRRGTIYNSDPFTDFAWDPGSGYTVV